MDKYADTFKLADILYTMGDYLEEANHNNDAVNVMMLAAKIYEGILPRTSQVNRKIDQVKRRMSFFYLKMSKHEKALTILKEVEDMQKTLYGTKSEQLAKTWKVIGNIYILKKQYNEARELFTKAHEIFK